MHAIIGPNGAGKTTFFNLVSGLLTPDSGHVFFRGQDITGLKPHQISRLGVKRTLQIKSVFPKLTVADNLWITKRAGHGFLHPFRDAIVGPRDGRDGRANARANGIVGAREAGRPVPCPTATWHCSKSAWR